MRRLALVDDLTGVANRRAFLERARLELTRAARYGLALSVAMLDIDRFKAVNDEFGHAGGDRVLKAVADALRKHVRVGVDEVGRLGGEEFAVLLPETAVEGAEIAAERLRWAIEALVVDLDGAAISVTVSFGVAEPISGHEKLEAWMSRADGALYAAKRNGRNRVCVADTRPAAHPFATAHGETGAIVF